MTTIATYLIQGVVIAFLVMLALWLIQLKTKNAGIVDIGWSATIPLLALVYAYQLADMTAVRTVLVVAMAVLWGGRLVIHIHLRSHGKPEDSRYAELRRAWGHQVNGKMFLFFQFQAIAAVIFSMPFLIVLLHTATTPTPLETSGFLIWLSAWLGESASDRQLARFKKDPASKGKVCEAGWWNYSRHPNYFFEWLIWVGVAVFALASPYGYLAILCPALMLFFLFKVTGIPATEEQSLKSKGDAYRRYQATTSSFIPWFKKEI
ncbi:MAG TPA: DUF1295 domain-containing protein [Kiritimatiellia bacterium]|nr:DUF1295 domain-containing protein [Kiritimatiellia bacterium]